MVFIMRLLAGGVGVLPPMIAMRLNMSSDYGHVAILFAYVLISLGPVFQYLNQGYLRKLSSNVDIKGEIFLIYYLAFAFGVLSFFSSGFFELIYFLIMIILSFALKFSEIRLLAIEKKPVAVFCCYILPHLLYSVNILIGHHFYTRWGANFAIYQIIAWGVACASALLFVGRQDIRKAFEEIFADGYFFSLKEWLFYFNGMLLSALENLPVIFLGLRGGGGIIAGFEVIKKVFSVIGVMVQALTMVHNTKLFKFAFNDFVAFDNEFIKLRKSIVSVSFIYILMLCVSMYFYGNYFDQIRFDGDINFALFLGLSTLVTAVFSAHGSGLTAMHGEKWWFAGAVLGFIGFFVVLVINNELKMVVVAIFVQNLILSITVYLGYRSQLAVWRRI